MPKNILSTAFTSHIQQLAEDHFSVTSKRLRIKEHQNYDFAISAFVQTERRGTVIDATLPMPERLPTHQKTQLGNFAIGTKGLTVSDETNGTIVHLLQTSIAAEMQCTFIHELMHAHSHGDFSLKFGKDLDEGVTEFFARELMAIEDRSMLQRRTKVYTHECNLAESLIDAFDRGPVVGAYFRGDKRIFDLVGMGFKAKKLVKDWQNFKVAQGRAEDPPLFQLLHK